MIESKKGFLIFQDLILAFSKNIFCKKEKMEKKREDGSRDCLLAEANMLLAAW